MKKTPAPAPAARPAPVPRLTLAQVEAARQRIADGLPLSPCPESIPLSELTGCRVYCKMENFQRTGSFKERGARNALLQLDTRARTRGVIAASAGNHALGLSWHGRLLGIPVTVVMPTFAPLIKIDSCRRMGARVIIQGADFAEATREARALAEKERLTYVHGFRDSAIVLGQGTLGLEVLEQVPEMEAIVVPVGGGGLLAGVALAIKSKRPEVLVYGVEPENAPSLTCALQAGEPVEVATRPTLADGLAISRVGEIPFSLIRRHVDRVITVREDEIALAVLRLLELEKTVVEGAGAAGLAALMSGRCPELAGRRVVLPLCGGNIDPAVLSRVIETGLVADGRLTRFTATISDRPGGLARLAQVIAGTGASVREISHDRAFAGSEVANVQVVCVVETRHRAHVAELHAALQAAGIPLR